MMRGLWGRVFKKKAIKLRIQGPIDIKNEVSILSQLSKVESRGADSLIVILNSYGGSLGAAKNISDSLRMIKQKGIKVYCFAEEFCLNSANLVLTSGTQCFASKLSVLGDFGFAHQIYSQNQDSRHYLQLEKVSSGVQPLDIILNSYQFSSEETSRKLIDKTTKELKGLVMDAREDMVRSKKVQIDNFKQNVLIGGSINPYEAQEYGLLDGVMSYNRFIKQRLQGYRVIESREDHQYRAISFIRSGLEVFRQE